MFNKEIKERYLDLSKNKVLTKRLFNYLEPAEKEKGKDLGAFSNEEFIEMLFVYCEVINANALGNYTWTFNCYKKWFCENISMQEYDGGIKNIVGNEEVLSRVEKEIEDTIIKSPLELYNELEHLSSVSENNCITISMITALYYMLYYQFFSDDIIYIKKEDITKEGEDFFIEFNGIKEKIYKEFTPLLSKMYYGEKFITIKKRVEYVIKLDNEFLFDTGNKDRDKVYESIRAHFSQNRVPKKALQKINLRYAGVAYKANHVPESNFSKLDIYFLTKIVTNRKRKYISNEVRTMKMYLEQV